MLANRAGFEPLGDAEELQSSATGAPGEYIDEMPAESPLVCFASCVTDCFLPSLAFSCCCCCFLKDGARYHLKDPVAEHKVLLCHRLQSWLIRHPELERSACCCIRPCLTVHDLMHYGATAISAFNERVGGGSHGSAWCSNMKLEVADPDTVKMLMTSPQEGGPALGQAWLRPHKLPHCSKGEPTFLLSLPNGLGGHRAKDSEHHYNLRRLIWKYLITEKASERQARTDPVVRRLLLQLRDAAHGKPMDEWRMTNADGRGLPSFILRYMHYVLFGLDLTSDQYEQLVCLYFNPSSALDKSTLILVLMRYVGALLEMIGNKAMSQLPARRKAAVDLYLSSPSLQGYATDEPLAAADFLDAIVTILGLAGLMGPLAAAAHTLGNFKDYIPADYKWPWGDAQAIRVAVLEAMRMQPAVYGSGLTLPKPMKCPFAAGQRPKAGPVVYPAGTPVHCNFVACNRNKAVWGADADKFDPKAHEVNLTRKGGPYPNFNSWGGDVAGDAHSGRECPGKELSLVMLVDIVDFVLAPTPPPALASEEDPIAPIAS